MTEIPGGQLRTDELGFLDEIIAASVSYLHVERMGDGHVWMGITLCDGSVLHVNFTDATEHLTMTAEHEPCSSPDEK